MRHTAMPTNLTYNKVWTTRSISKEIFKYDTAAYIKRTERWINQRGLDFKIIQKNKLVDEHNRKANISITEEIISNARKKRKSVLFVNINILNANEILLFANDGRDRRRWIFFKSEKLNKKIIFKALQLLAYAENKDILIIPTGDIIKECRNLCRDWKSNQTIFQDNKIIRIGLEIYSHSQDDIFAYINKNKQSKSWSHFTHLQNLESEAIHVMREVVAEADNPVMLYSVGKDSSVMLHLARKAFYPSKPPFPLLHVDTRWKFKAMYEFRDYMAKTSNMDLIVHINPEGIKKNINPIEHGSSIHTNIMKTEGLKQALEKYKFDVAFGGARRDEEKSRSKERMFSFRSKSHRWDPKNQRPEIWNLYNCKKNQGENIRVFPLSNWTELDIWQYIYQEQIPIVPLYFAQERAVIERNGMIIMLDDDRLKIKPTEKIEIKKIRFRTLGCYPLTGAFQSDADDLSSIVLEILSSKLSERQGRAIDSDTSSSMEKKKQEGYF